MTEHPIICNSEVVRNIFAGIQTQDRRPVKPQPAEGYRLETDSGCLKREPDEHVWINGHAYHHIKSPFGKPGDVLCVREAIRAITYQRGPDFDYGEHCIEYIADKHLVKCDEEHDDWWYHNWHVRPTTTIPSIHMPKWACRLRLTVKRVWAERIQDISEEDAKAEGAEPENAEVNIMGKGAYVNGFFDLWNSLYGPDAWDSNDFVWCCEFEVKKYFPKNSKISLDSLRCNVVVSNL